MADDMRDRMAVFADLGHTDACVHPDQHDAVIREWAALKAAIEQVCGRLDWLIANGFGARTADLVDLRAALDHPTDQTGDTNRGVLGRILTVRQDVDRRLHRALFGDPPRTGVHVINDQMADDYDPPSTSVNPRQADPTACQGCADSLVKCRADGGRCCDLCQHPQRPRT